MLKIILKNKTPPSLYKITYFKIPHESHDEIQINEKINYKI